VGIIVCKINVMANFIKQALDKVLTYTTPPAVLKYMEIECTLGNPPWKIKRKK
jgi:hypothetical protein